MMRHLLLLTLAAASPAAAYQAVGTADGQDGKTLYRPPARRVLLMTRQRSGSTSFVMMLDQHPKVQDMGEGMSFSHNERNLAALGITPADVRRDPTDAVQRVLASCDAPTCVAEALADAMEAAEADEARVVSGARSQAGQDAWVLNLMGGRPGYFVEAGAHDGVTHSNTAALERDHGWRGLCVERCGNQNYYADVNLDGAPEI